MKKIKDLYRRYKEWELEDVHIDLGYYNLTTNNFTIYTLPIYVLLLVIGYLILK